jgi:beta-lactamase superfamily II metal-dependent hydrolase
MFQLVISVLTLFYAQAVYSETQAHLPCTLKSHWPAFSLSTQTRCRASLEITLQDRAQGSQDLRVCLSETLWREWLSQKYPPMLCGVLSGRYKITAPLSNDATPDSNYTKPTRLSFFLSRLPRSEPTRIFWLWSSIQNTRESLSQALKPVDHWGVVRSLVLSERDPKSPLDFLRLLGFFHLFTASGVHLYALAATLNWFSKKGLKLAQIPISNALLVARLVTILTWLWAWLLCGCRLGMLRPLFVVGAQLAARALGFRWRFWSPFALSMLIEFSTPFIRGTIRGTTPWIPNPAQIHVALAVGGFLMALQFQEAAQKRTEKRKTFILPVLGGWIFVAIVQALQESLVAIAAPLLGVATLPIFCTFLYPWILIDSLLGVFSPLTLCLVRISNDLLKSCVEFLLKLPAFWLLSPTTLWISMVLALAGVGVSIQRARLQRLTFWIISLFALILFRSILGSQHILHKPHDPRQNPTTPPLARVARDVIQLDVGQGDSALVLSNEGAGLIDAGSAHALTDAQWMRVLASQNVSRLNWIALTHLDEDHRGGLERLSRLIPIGCVATSKEELQSERGAAIAKSLFSRGIRMVSWNDGCVLFPTFHLSHAPLRFAKSAKSAGNHQMSAVLIPLQSGDFYLSAGDAEGRDELPMLRWADQSAHALSLQSGALQGRRVLKISHHGSRTSSDPEALRIFHPDFSVISVGLGNSYGHPSPEVLKRLEAMRIPVHRTDQKGLFRVEAVLHPPQAHRP